MAAGEENSHLKRRQFLQTAGAGLAAAQRRRAGHRAILAGTQMAAGVELAEIARYDLRRVRDSWRSMLPKRPTANSRSRFSLPAKSCRACRSLDAVQNGTVEVGHTATYYYLGKDPAFAFDTGSVRPQCAPAERLVLSRRRQRADQRVLQGIQLYIARRRQHRQPRWAAGSARRSRPSTISRA